MKPSDPGNASFFPNYIKVSPWYSSRGIRIPVSLSNVLRRKRLKTLLRCQGLKISLTTPTIESARLPQLRAKTKLRVLFVIFSSRFQKFNRIVSSSVHSLPHAYFPPEFIFGSLCIYCLAFFQPVFIVPGSWSLQSVQYLVFIIPSLLEELGFQSGTIDNTRFEIEFEKAPGTL